MLPFLLVIFFTSLVNANVSNLIIGGNDAYLAGYSYFAAVEYAGQNICGGSIITPNYVITSAQCEAPMDNLNVRTGTILRERGGTLYKVVKFIRHENYTIGASGIPANDIALIKVEKPIRYDSTQKAINLFDARYSLPSTGWISGFGVINNGKVADRLQEVVVPILPTFTCKLIYSSRGGLSDGHLCASNMGTIAKDICTGDMGGALEVNGRKLAGIISWSAGCAKPYYPSVYTEIAYYRDWIEANIKE